MVFPTVIIIFLIIRVSQQYDAEICANYDLVFQQDYPLSLDLSNECQSNECIILASNVLVASQDVSSWCHKNTTSLFAYLKCSGTMPWSSFNGRQVKFVCRRSKAEQCAEPETSCIPEFMQYCKYDDSKSYGCPVYPKPNTTMDPTSTTPATTPSSDGTVGNLPSETTTLETTEMPVETTTSAPVCDQGLCPPGECFFRDHCYFMSPVFEINQDRKTEFVMDICGQNQSLARGLAVETSDENDFIQELIRENGYYGVFLTAGGRNFWTGWSSFVNQSLLVPSKGLLESLYLSVNYIAGELFWSGAVYPPPLYVICERELVWSMAFPWLRKACYDEYVSQKCNSSFCCATDDEKGIWFQCEKPEVTVATKQCIGDASNTAKWLCFNGSFTSEAPDSSQCHCETPCSAEFQGTLFSACPLKYGYASCPDNGKGYMRWRCLPNGTFDGIKPDVDLCCGNDEVFNKQDPFLNVWVACPNTTVTRFVECWDEDNSAGNPFRHASVNWTCGPTGFLGVTPDYSACCNESCQAVDYQGLLWQACKGMLARNPCPDGMKGTAHWRCSITLNFINDSPDYSDCYSGWVDDVEDMINNNKDAIVIMGRIHDELKVDSSGSGLKKVINITSSCIDLFVSQNHGNGSIEIFENFTATYIDVLDDLTKNSSFWTQLTDQRKNDYTEATIVMTNRLGFALNQVSDENVAGYVNSFQANETDLSLWMAYSKNLTEMSLSYNATNNLCSVDFYNAEAVTPVNGLFSAVGIVFPRLFSSTAFPVRSMSSSRTVMNSAVLSMTVADVSSNQPVKQRKNISIRVSFKHSAKARFPDGKIIPRRLYEGEMPSPIIGAAQCFFYERFNFNTVYFQDVALRKVLNENCNLSSCVGIVKRDRNSGYNQNWYGRAAGGFTVIISILIFSTQYNPGTWSSSGCSATLSSSDETTCDCLHLTSFAVLVDVHEYVRDPALEAFSLTCSILSIIGLILTLIVFKAVKIRKLKLDSDRTLIDVNCCLCLLVSHAMIVTVLDKKFFYISDKMCSVVAGILHYFLTAAFFWMAVEACHLYHLIVLVFTREGSYRSHYFIAGYVLPLIPIMLTELCSEVLQKRAYGRDEICWLEVDFIWSFNGPAFLLTGLNLVVIIIAMRAAITKKESNSFKKWWIWCKGLAFLCTLLGVTWLVGLVYIEVNVPRVVEFLFVFLNGLQGVYIFIFQCVLNNQVRPVLLQFFLRRSRRTRRSSFSRISQKATAISSEVDFSAKTGISTWETSSDVKIVQCPPLQPGQWMFRANTPRRQWTNSNISPCDDMVRQLQRRMMQSSDSFNH